MQVGSSTATPTTGPTDSDPTTSLATTTSVQSTTQTSGESDETSETSPDENMNESSADNSILMPILYATMGVVFLVIVTAVVFLVWVIWKKPHKSNRNQQVDMSEVEPTGTNYVAVPAEGTVGTDYQPIQ